MSEKILTKLEICDTKLELAKKEDKPAHWMTYKTYLDHINRIINKKIYKVLDGELETQ